MSLSFDSASPRAIPIFAFETVREVANDLEKYLTNPRATYVRYGCVVWLEAVAKVIEQTLPDEDQLTQIITVGYMVEAQTEKGPFDLETLRNMPGEELYEKRDCYLETARRIRAFVSELTFNVDLDLPLIESEFRAAVFDFLNLPDPRKEASNVPTNPETQRIARLKN